MNYSHWNNSKPIVIKHIHNNYVEYKWNLNLYVLQWRQPSSPEYKRPSFLSVLVLFSHTVTLFICLWDSLIVLFYKSILLFENCMVERIVNSQYSVPNNSLVYSETRNLALLIGIWNSEIWILGTWTTSSIFSKKTN